MNVERCPKCGLGLIEEERGRHRCRGRVKRTVNLLYSRLELPKSLEEEREVEAILQKYLSKGEYVAPSKPIIRIITPDGTEYVFSPSDDYLQDDNQTGSGQNHLS